MYTSINGFTNIGIMGYSVQVEVDLSNGLPGFDIVGLPNGSIRESRERVRAAIKNSGFDFTQKRITVNLAPADVKKEGSMFDLPIAVGLLLLSGAIKRADRLADTIFLGELSLDGRIKGVNGVLAMVLEAEALGKHERIILSIDNFDEGSLAKNIEVVGISDIKELVAYLNGEKEVIPIKAKGAENRSCGFALERVMPDMSDVKGHWSIKRALEVAAAGNHNILLAGPPGSGKTMLAKRLLSIMPKLTYEESLEVTKIFSVAGLLERGKGLVENRPFRSPHHTMSTVSMAGGGKVPRPGEVSLAHRGILFLDEMPEFCRASLETLRQPLEDENITITRLAGAIKFPASFLLVGSMNYCSCGFFNDGTDRCSCSESQISNYRGRISGPLMDRIDIKVEVPSVDYDDIVSDRREESSIEIRLRVEKAVEIQRERLKSVNLQYNSQMEAKQLRKYCGLDTEANKLLKAAALRLNLSSRGITKVLKIARTISDLDGSEKIKKKHLMEAIGYRNTENMEFGR